jgi:hypothetical protein
MEFELTLQNYVNKHTADPENVEGKRKMKRINLQDLKLTQTRYQNLFVPTINCL